MAKGRTNSGKVRYYHWQRAGPTLVTGRTNSGKWLDKQRPSVCDELWQILGLRVIYIGINASQMAGGVR